MLFVKGVGLPLHTSQRVKQKTSLELSCGSAKDTRIQESSLTLAWRGLGNEARLPISTRVAANHYCYRNARRGGDHTQSQFTSYAIAVFFINDGRSRFNDGNATFFFFTRVPPKKKFEFQGAML